MIKTYHALLYQNKNNKFVSILLNRFVSTIIHEIINFHDLLFLDK